MLTKEDITNFLTRTMNDRTLRIDKTLLAEICDQALKGIDLQLNMVPNNGRTALELKAITNLDEAIAAFEEATGFILPRPAALADPGVITEDANAGGSVLDGTRADEISIDEMLDYPLSDVPQSGTIAAGGNPECDTQTPKSKPQSSSKAKPPKA